MDVRERQEDELSAVQAIYGDAYTSVTSAKPAWRNQVPLKECRIRLDALEDDLKDRVSIVLHIKLPATYPKTAPTISLNDPIGVTAECVQGLAKLLEAKAKGLVPNEAIFELASEAASYITQHHAIIQQNVPSLIDQQAARTALESEAIAARLTAEEEANKEARARERKELWEQFEADKLRQKERQQISRKSTNTPNDSLYTAGTSGRPFQNVKLTAASQDVTVVKGSAIYTSTQIGVLYNAEAVDENAVKYPIQLLSVDLSTIRSYLHSSQGSKRLSALLAQLTRLQGIRFKHLSDVYGFDFDAETGVLEVLIEPLGGSLQDVLFVAQRLPTDRIATIALQVAEGLAALHDAGLLHKCLSPERVHLLSRDPSSLKLSSACYMQDLLDINRSTPFAASRPFPSLPDAWRCPEAVLEPLAYTQARDVWDFGLLVVALHGADTFDVYQEPTAFAESMEEGRLKEVLCHIFLPSKERSSIQDLRGLLSIRIPTAPLTPQHSQATKLTNMIPAARHDAALPGPPRAPASAFWQPAASIPTSRYRAEFEEVEFLGKGGFGKVVKALNKLDRNFYAIKKVKLSSDPAVEQKVLREVTTWSRLSHPAIVRYHTAWVESEAESMDGDAVRQSFDPSYPETAAKSTSEEDSADDLASAVEADFDLGIELEDADFLSVNPHISASSSYPRIHFGNDSDDSSLPSRNPSRRSPFVSAPTGSPPPLPQRQQQRTLYIQMEYISGRTLREAIDDGFSHEEAWRVLSQILSAMVYYSALSITHRDLKPQNCFIDAEGHVKVGDFGLAVETKAALDEAQHQNRPSHVAAELSDLTSGVGTSLYMSPEMVSQRGNQEMPLRERAYASRIDMYSLGILFFEMVHCMHTKMERLVTIKNLRLPQIQMPIDFQGTQSQRQLIRSLLVHDPQERPSPQEVLQSGILPAPLVDETVAEVSRLISSGKSPHRSTVLKALFSMTTREAQISDLLFDHGVPTEIDVNAQVAKAKLVCIFESRGAVELALDGPIPLTSLYELGEGRRPVKLLKQDGNVLMLPYDHTVPLCRRAARDDALSRLKRYTVGPVYRQRDLGAGQLRAPVVASFDIVTAQFTLAAEAECIQLVDATLDEFAMSDAFSHTLGHSGILQYAVEDVPPAHRNGLLRFLEVASSRGTVEPRKAAAELARLPGVTGKTIQLLSALQGTYDLATSTGTAGLDSLVKSHPKLQSFVQDLKTVLRLAQTLGCHRKLLIAPLLAVNVHLHMIKPTCMFHTSLHSKSTQTIAVGGRYDGLTDLFLPPDRITAPSVVGVSLAMTQLAHAVNTISESAKAVSSPERQLPTRRCDVYVVSFARGLEEVRLGVVADLWKHGIKADLMYEGDSSTPDQMIARRRLENLLCLVIVKANQAGREQTCKVRDLVRSGEDEVLRADLVEYLQEHIAEQMHTDAHRPTGTTTSSRGGGATLGEIHFLTQQDAEKKKQFMRLKNRNMHADKAAAAVLKQLAALSSDVPIYVVDLEASAVDIMRGAPRWYAQDSEAYKRIADSMPAAKRPALQSLRDAIRQQAQGQVPHVFLYSSRIDKSWPLVLE